jgi:UDP-N-acetylglucosamine:LPS N-acetylglucosamine transferase
MLGRTDQHESVGSAVRQPRVLALASGGGHWIQLMRLMAAFDGADVHFATTSPDFAATVAAARAARGQRAPGYHVFVEANRWQKARLARQAWQLLSILRRVRPDAIVTTGAAPGYLAIRLGRLMGARGCWIDSIANPEELSLSGQQVGRYADLWLTQWPELARPGGPLCRGAVL